MDEIILFTALGVTVEEVTGRRVGDILSPDVKVKIFDYIDSIDERGRLTNNERLLALFERVTDGLLTKIDEEDA